MTPHETHLRMRPTFKPKTLLLADYHPSFKGMYLDAKTAHFWSAASPATHCTGCRSSQCKRPHISQMPSITANQQLNILVLLAARSTVKMLKCNMCGLLALTFSKYVANAGYFDPKLHGFCLKWRYADYGFLENLEAPCRRRSCAVAEARRRVPDWGFIGT